jgi:drug/metabolite transporter (DMT)-like permease
MVGGLSVREGLGGAGRGRMGAPVPKEYRVSQVRNVGLLLVLGIGWGSTQPLGKIAASTGHGPFALMFWQLAICTVFLGAVNLARGRWPKLTREALIFYVVVALVGTVVPSYGFYVSVARLPAGVMSILISTVPLIAFPLAMALGLDRFEGRRMLGLLLGLTGVALIALPRSSLPDPAMVVFLPLAMMGPTLYAFEGLFVSRYGMAGMDPVQAMFGASFVGLVLCVPLVLGSGQWVDPLAEFGRPEQALVLSSVLHAMLYSTYVGLAARAGSVFASQSSYVVTAAGLCWSMLLLGEQFSPWIWLALAVMLTGLTLVRPRLRVSAAAAAQAAEARIGDRSPET